MTTVVYRGGTIAADSLVVSDDTIDGCVTKVFSHGGFLYGFAGNLTQCFIVRDSFVFRGEKPEIDGEKCFSFFRVDRNGVISYLDSPEYVWIDINASYYAIGSGRSLALGALAMGATAKKAVEVAIDRDIYSGGYITELSLDE